MVKRQSPEAQYQQTQWVCVGQYDASKMDVAAKKQHILNYEWLTEESTEDPNYLHSFKVDNHD